jgi:hypothetical protein
MTMQAHNQRPRRANRFQPGLEALEDRNLLSGSPFAADAARCLTTPTGWGWHPSITAGDLNNITKQYGVRIIDIEVENPSTQTFAAATVANSGPHARTSWFFPLLSKSQLADKVSKLKARILDLESYSLNGKERFAAVLVSNKGWFKKTWDWDVNKSADFVAKKLKNGNYRLIDIEKRDNGNLDVVMVKNKGVDAKTWWWYHDVSAGFVEKKVKDNHARITDIERQGNGNFSVIMEYNPGDGWFWFTQKTAEEVHDWAMAYGQRIVALDPYVVNGQTYFAVSMLQNAYIGPPKTTPLAIKFASLYCTEESDESSASDEPYVVFYVANLKNPAASYATRTTLFGNFDSGETNSLLPMTVWGPGGGKAAIVNRDDLVILASLVENDDTPPDQVVTKVQQLMSASVQSVAANPGMGHDAQASKLIADMNGALAAGVITDGNDDEYARPLELRLSEVELYKARTGQTVVHSLNFAGDNEIDGGRYWVTFHISA